MRPYYYQEQEQYRPQIRFGFGGGWTPAVKHIIIITCAVYVIQLILRGREAEGMLASLMLDPSGVFRGQIWQLVTYTLLHGAPFHILLNMFILWMFGKDVERALGTARLIALYVFSGIVAGISTCVFDPTALVIGASGSVLGVIMAFGMLFPNRIILLMLIIPVPARIAVMIFTVIELLNCSSGVMRGTGIAGFAHLGGLAFGYLFIKTRPWWELFLRGLQRPRAEKPDEGVTVEDEVEMDRLLEKIKDEGLHTLSWREKRFLDRISQRLRDR